MRRGADIAAVPGGRALLGGLLSCAMAAAIASIVTLPVVACFHCLWKKV